MNLDRSVYTIQHATQRGLNLVYSAKELQMEVHVDSAKRGKPENDRAAPSPSMTSSLAMLSTENGRE